MGYLNMTGFTYDGIDSESFGLIIGYFDTPDTTIETGYNVNVERGEFNMVRHAPNQYGTTYQDTLKFEFGVLKRENTKFTYEDSRAINKWLMGSTAYKRFSFHDDLPEGIHFYAVCTEISDVAYHDMTGKKLTFVCNAPYGFLDTRNLKTTVTGRKDLNIFNISDDGYYYPTIKLRVAADYVGNIVLTNNSDTYKNAAGILVGKQMTINFEHIDSLDGEHKDIVIDCEKARITDAEGSLISAYRLGWRDISDLYWFRLVPDKNEVTVTGNCEAEFICEFPRKMGAI